MKRRFFALILVLVMALALLTACSGGKEGSQGSEGTSNGDANGGDGKYKIAVVVKGSTNGWFIRMDEGIKRWAAENGIDAYMTGPTDTDSAQQIQIIKDVINQGIDALCVVPVDPAACEPILQEARDKGIKVICRAGSTVNNCDYDIEAFDNAGYGAFIMDNLAELMGETGTYTTMVGFLTTASHNEWADGAVARQQEHFTDMTLLPALPRVESENNTEVAYEKAKEVLKMYPEVTGFVGTCSDDTPGIARAINELGLKGQVFVVGTGMPNECREKLKNGDLTCITLWDPADAGYAMCELARQVLDGKEIGNGTNLGLEAYSNLQVSEDKPNLLMGSGFISLTAENVDDYNF
jgi:simple sugar transport system substrate-binding protein